MEEKEAADRLECLKNKIDVLNEFVDFLKTRVARDEDTKRAIFLTATSAYTEDPQNLFLRGPPSIGKSFVAREVLRFFPREDVWFLGGLSPTALVHMTGQLVDEEGKLIDPILEKPRRENFRDQNGKLDVEAYRAALKNWEERLRNSHYQINLYNKILVFLEAPHIETFYMLRPILSHDTEEISYRFTDKNAKGQLRTTHVVIKGWPATIFCTTEARYIEDLATRGWTITPEMSSEKYREANLLAARRDMDPFAKSALLSSENANKEAALRDYVRYVLAARANLRADHAAAKVVIPFAEEIAKVYPAKISRDMRDFKRFLSLIKVSATLNWCNRPRLIITSGEIREEFTLTINIDFFNALRVFQSFAETTRSGLPSHIIEFYHQIVEPLCAGGPKHYSDLADAYRKKFEASISTRTISSWCDLLEQVGWIDRETDPNDKRKILVFPVRKMENFSIFEKIEIFSPEKLKEWFNGLKNIAEINSPSVNNNFGIYLQLENGGRLIDDLDKINIRESELISAIFSFDLNALNQKIGSENMPKSNLLEISRISEKTGDFQGDQKSESPQELYAKPFVELTRSTPIRWLPCACGRTGLEFHVKFVDGEELFICSECASRLKEKWMGGVSDCGRQGEGNTTAKARRS